MQARRALMMAVVGWGCLSGVSVLAQGQAPAAAKTDAGTAAAPTAASGAAAPPAGKVELTWWGHAAFVVRTPGGATLVLDPWLKNPKAPQGAAWPSQVDAILVTHGHSDHVGETVELANKTNAQVIGSFELTHLLGVKNATGGNIGGSVTVKDATIHFVEAVHSSGFGNDPKAPKYGGPAMGYVIEIKGGPTLYHAGDTGTFSSMELIGERYRPRVALLPIGGHFTMDPQGAAIAARLLGAQTVIPMHYGTFPMLTGSPAELEKALPRAKAKAKVRNLEIGKPATF